MRLWSLFLALGVPSLASAAITCLDGSGHPTDFWYAFKYNDGWDYAYMAKGEKLAKASDSLDSKSSSTTRTLDQLYKGHKDLSYAFWSDEHYDGRKVASPYAHAKGVLAFDGKTGFWLTHSLPKWPGDVKAGKPDYERASYVFGQSYLCINIDGTAFSQINNLAVVNRFSVYDAADNANMGSSFTTWALHKKHSSDNTLIASVTSAGGQEFIVFAKSAAWDDELYASLVAPHLKTSLYTETWQNGAGSIGSSCSGDFAVLDVASVKFPSKSFSESRDHSKWAVSSAADSHYFCVGDINRQEGQKRRGGGTVCINDQLLAQQMLKVVDDYKRCGQGTVIL